jgi:hypothetical protein
MTFDQLTIVNLDSADKTLEYLIVFHSQDAVRNKRYRRGSVLRIKNTQERLRTVGMTSFEHVKDSSLVISPRSRDDRLVVTSGMKKRIKTGWGERSLERALVKCFYPMTSGSPYYADEELFAAKLSGDYSIILEKLRKEYMIWKKHK